MVASVPDLEGPAADLARLAEEVREVAYALRQLGRDSRDDPGRLDEVEARLALYRKLGARFRCKPDDLAARREDVEMQLAAIERDDADLAGLDAPLAISWAALTTAAAALTTARKKAGKEFARAVQGHMKALSLTEAKITVEVEPIALGCDPFAATPPEHGADRVEIVFTPNPGESPRPLRKIASGGRVVAGHARGQDRCWPKSIACRCSCSTRSTPGSGGRLGAALGRALAELSKTRQVLCVTHLPQMASFAKHQWGDPQGGLEGGGHAPRSRPCPRPSAWPSSPPCSGATRPPSPPRPRRRPCSPRRRRVRQRGIRTQRRGGSQSCAEKVILQHHDSRFSAQLCEPLRL